MSGATVGSDFGQNEQVLLHTSIKLNSTQVGLGTPLYNSTTSTDFDLVGNEWDEAAELLGGGSWDAMIQLNWEDLD